MANLSARPTRVTSLGLERPYLWYRPGLFWEAAKDYWEVLRPMRFCVVVWALVTLLLALPQSRDALLALFENAFAGPFGWRNVESAAVLVLFAAAVLFWAFETFYWGRFVSRLPVRPRREPSYRPPLLDDAAIEKLAETTPRRLGILVLLSVWGALIWANWFNLAHEATLTAMMAGVFVAYRKLVLGRRKIAAALHRRAGLAMFEVDPQHRRDLEQLSPTRAVKHWAAWLSATTLAVFVASGFFPLPDWLAPVLTVVWVAFGLWACSRIAGLPPSTAAFVRFNIIVFGVLFLAAVDPQLPAIGALGHLPSPPVIMSVAAAWVFVGTFFLAVPGELLRLPIASVAVLLAVGFSFVGRFDNHVVRVSRNDPGTAADVAGTTAPAAFAEWWANVPKPNDPRDPVPLVLVATAGGASRAAYWTTKVLAQIEFEHPGFHKFVFAISSVSGGSLGAAVYEAMLHDIALNKNADAPQDYCQGGLASRRNLVYCGLNAINHDFLGPTFLAGLYPDLAQRFLPGALLPDRAAALEHSWEHAWRDTMPNSSTGLDRPFHSLWRDKSGKLLALPALIINGTSEKTGRKIITSNLVIENDEFSDAIDYFRTINPKNDIPVSTAVHNSARFPYIDAAGTLLTGTSGTTDRIVDGGYFENYGAGSVYDLLRQLASPAISRDKKLKFFVIQITSDPELISEQARRDIAWAKPLPFGLNIAADVTAPPVALFDTGSALGYRTIRGVRDVVEAAQDALPHYAEFRLTDKSEALSWVLSRKVIGALNKEWCNNASAYQQLRVFMGWDASHDDKCPT